jgi:hypothetical protein
MCQIILKTPLYTQLCEESTNWIHYIWYYLRLVLKHSFRPNVNFNEHFLRNFMEIGLDKFKVSIQKGRINVRYGTVQLPKMDPDPV